VARSLRKPATPTLRAARANRVFPADEKRIRMENAVIDKSIQGMGFVVRTFAGCVRTDVASV
jgi:hypothetical protein